MANALVFLSHITEEADVAKALKMAIEDAFLGLIEVFVSSDQSSISVGSRWLDEITDALNRTTMMIVLCSPQSISRPWINFECGAGWVRGIKVIPICHSGLRPSNLPVPVSLLQGIPLSDADHLRDMFSALAALLKSKLPTVDFKALATNLQSLERRHSARRDVMTRVEHIAQIDTELGNALRTLASPGVTRIRELPESLFRKIEDALQALKSGGFLEFEYTVQGVGFGGTAGGNFGDLSLKATPGFVEAINSRG